MRLQPTFKRTLNIFKHKQHLVVYHPKQITSNTVQIIME